MVQRSLRRAPAQNVAVGQRGQRIDPRTLLLLNPPANRVKPRRRSRPLTPRNNREPQQPPCRPKLLRCLFQSSLLAVNQRRPTQDARRVPKIDRSPLPIAMRQLAKRLRSHRSNHLLRVAVRVAIPMGRQEWLCLLPRVACHLRPPMV